MMSCVYKAKYKCRLCGKKFVRLHTNNIIATRCMYEVILGFDSGESLCPKIIEQHICKDGSFGIADFIGFEKAGDD